MSTVPAPPHDAPADAAAADPPEKLPRLLRGRLAVWLIIGAWIAVLAGLSPLAAKVNDVQKNDAVSMLPRGADATRVAAYAARFPAADALPAVAVFTRDGALTAADRAAIEAKRTAAAAFALGGRVAPVEYAVDGRAATVTAMMAREDRLFDRIDGLRALARDGLPPGLTGAVGGPAAGLVDTVKVFSDLDTDLFAITGAVVAVLLLLIYRSPVLWLLPLLAVGAATQVSEALIYLLGKEFALPVDGQSAGITTVLVFGVGTDYALLLLARYREELRRHPDRRHAMLVALRRSAPAILASAGTVVLGLLCLLVADLNSNRSIGAVGALGVLAGAATTLMLLPALLVAAGRWVFWPFVPRPGVPARPARGWTRLGEGVAARPRLVWAATAVALGALVFGVAGVKIGTTQAESFTTTPESVTAQERIATHFPAGSGAPAEIVAPVAARGRVAAAAGGVPGVVRLRPPAVSTDGALVSVPVVLADAPDSPAAADTVRRLRAATGGIPGAVVGGPTAQKIDIEAAADHDRRLVIPLVLAAVLLVLVLLLRALVAPLLLITTVVLSYAAALGAAALLLRGVFDLGAFDHSTPLLGFVFLVALGVDYNIFLAHRIREEVGRVGHRAGVLRGLTATGGVITSAGLVLAATFTVLATLPLVTMLGIGLVVAVGVVLDTLVVRSVLVPALLLDTGPVSWWPRRTGVGR
ncbi:putative membrane protein ActII-3 [Pilimelia terevasa]|uniref:Putative membrane protein ActII-3 n=1 Tax=Pilimelia terevasa TaxID=53372 RepID=A0A8J3BR32_9ACTN|nr:MMPL family transporter [Pilimelia terevasa]GGK30342.1 putative membrane protein ActII-3 [Pilimelia terevasa]